MKHNKLLLSEFGGMIRLQKNWAQLILQCMKYVKRRGSAKVRVPEDVFHKLKLEFLTDIKVAVLMEDIPSSLIINWNQTGISFIPGASWSMACQGRNFRIGG